MMISLIFTSISSEEPPAADFLRLDMFLYLVDVCTPFEIWSQFLEKYQIYYTQSEQRLTSLVVRLLWLLVSQEAGVPDLQHAALPWM